MQPRLVKTGGRLIKHARYYLLLLAERHLTRCLSGRWHGGSGRRRCLRNSLGYSSRKIGRAGGEGTERCLWRRQRRQLRSRASWEGQNRPSWVRLGGRRKKNVAGMT